MSDFNCFRAYEGAECTLKKWLWLFDFSRPAPKKVRILRDYPKTLLLELTYADTGSGIKVSPRKSLKLITKAAMLTGDVILKVDQTGELLTGPRMVR